ncbi:MAG: LysM peptidoglycan-binding domain-containing protein [Clostridiaceae bacterium]|nr:LysM peptidoglycan-binding domain-containing protein [Clostridiaceae bacterium]
MVETRDTLGKIATNFNTTVDEPAKLNNLANPNMIYV